MATGRIGVTPTLRTRWSKQPSAGTTSLSGLDDNSVSLVYDVGYEAVYRNGVLLSRGNDYTATSGTSITLIDATLTGDVIEVLANQLVPLTDAISKGQFTAKGALLSATAASTPGVLTVGANDTVLTADSSTATGLKWATPAGGAITYTLLNSGGTALSGSSTVTVSSLSGYDFFKIFVRGATIGSDSALYFRINADNTSKYSGFGQQLASRSTYNINQFIETNQAIDSQTSFAAIYYAAGSRSASGLFEIEAGNSTGVKILRNFFGSGAHNDLERYWISGVYSGTSVVSSISVIGDANFTAGTVYVYGGK